MNVLSIGQVRNGGSDAKTLALIDESVRLRRCALYRNAFKGNAVSYPAALLESDPLADWMRRNRVAVDVTTAAQLDRALAAGIEPLRVVMHQKNGSTTPAARAVCAGVGRFVVGSAEQMATLGDLADRADRIQRIVVDVTDTPGQPLVAQVVPHRRLDLVGLHCRLDDPDDPIGAGKLRRLIADMAQTRREHAALLTRISLAGLDVGDHCLEPRILRRVAEALGDVIGEACARHRYPRPALTVAPRRSALTPAS
jgi:Pyridoxal-dependent decarboxylase, pyridoxal binding domain